MKLHVLVGSEADAALLRRLLEDEIRAGTIGVFEAHPASSLYSAARTLITVRNQPVALVVDSGSTEPSAAALARASAEEVVGSSSGLLFRVLVGTPALKAILFHRGEAVRRAFPGSSELAVEIGRVSPRDGFLRLDPANDGRDAYSAVVGALARQDVEALRRSPPIRDVLEFLDELGRDPARPLAAASAIRP